MRRLVVADVLCYHLRPVAGVIHQVRHGVVALVVGCVDDERVVVTVLRPRHYLLPPVAQQVAQHAGVVLRVVVERAHGVVRAVHLNAVEAVGGGVVPLQHRLVVVAVGEQPVPVHPVVERASAPVRGVVLDDVTVPVIEVRHLRAKLEVSALAFGVEVRRNGSASVVACRRVPEDGASGSVPEVSTEGAFLVRLIHLQPLVVGVEVSHVQGVAVPKPSAVEQRSVVVEGSCTIDYLLFAVPVAVSHRYPVRSLAP